MGILLGDAAVVEMDRIADGDRAEQAPGLVVQRCLVASGAEVVRDKHQRSAPMGAQLGGVERGSLPVEGDAHGTNLWDRELRHGLSFDVLALAAHRTCHDKCGPGPVMLGARKSVVEGTRAWRV